MMWYYQLDSRREGPVDETTLLKLYQDSKISESTLVWHENFEDGWKPISQSGLSLPKISNRLPPPLPLLDSIQPSIKSTATSSAGTSSGFNAAEFLDSPLTAQIVGNKFDKYKPKWEKLIARANGDIGAASKRISWNWAAFFFNSSWLFYRKLYLAGAACLAIQMTLLIFIDKGPLGIICSLAVGLFGNALYLQKVSKIYQIVRGIVDSSDITKFITKQGQTNLGYSIGIPLAVTVIAGLIYLVVAPGSLLENEASCSSDETVKLVKQVIVNEMNKENLGILFDMSHSSLDVDYIRTETSTSKKSTCAADVSIKVKANTSLFSGPNNQAPDPQNVKAGEDMLPEKLKQHITYTSEYTDKGDSIYVHVEGMNFNIQ